MLAAAAGLVAYLDHVGRGSLPLLLPPPPPLLVAPLPPLTAAPHRACGPRPSIAVMADHVARDTDLQIVHLRDITAD